MPLSSGLPATEAEISRLRGALAEAEAQVRVFRLSQGVAWSYYRRTRTQRDRARTLRRRAAQRTIGLRGRAQRLAARQTELEAALTELRDVLIDTALRVSTNYDWNADPDRMTLRQGLAWERVNALQAQGKELPRE